MIGDINYFYQDQLGSVTHVANFQSGQMVETYRYDAFGAPTIRDGVGNPRSASAINNRFMFTGREYAPGSLGFYEYRARAYHPALGRFTQPDPIDFGGRDTNLFRYVGNSPINYRDPSGLLSPDAKLQTEMLSTGGAEATTPGVVVNGTAIPDVPSSGDSIGLSPGIGGDGVGGAGDSGGGNDGGGGGGSRVDQNGNLLPPATPTPPPTPTPTPSPMPTPPAPSPIPGWFWEDFWKYYEPLEPDNPYRIKPA